MERSTSNILYVVYAIKIIRMDQTSFISGGLPEGYIGKRQQAQIAAVKYPPSSKRLVKDCSFECPPRKSKGSVFDRRS